MFTLLPLLAQASPVDLALGEAVHDLAVSPDGDHLAVADDAHLTVRDAKSLALVWAASVQWDRWRRVEWLDERTLRATHMSGATYAFDLVDRSVTPLPTRPAIDAGPKVQPLHLARFGSRASDPLRDYDHHVLRGYPLLPEGRIPERWIEGVAGWQQPFAIDDRNALHGSRDGARVSSQPFAIPIQSLLPDEDRLAVLHEDGSLSILDEDLQLLSEARGPIEGPASAIVLQPSGRLAWVGRPDGALTLVDRKRGRVRAEQPAGRGIADLATADDLVLALDLEGASLWDVARGERRWTREGPFQQGVIVGDQSVLLGLDGRGTWVDDRGRTVRETCLTVDCDGMRPAFLGVSSDQRLVVLEPSYTTSPRRSELIGGRVSVHEPDGTLRVSRSIDHELGERPRVGDRLLSCGGRRVRSMLDLIPSPVVAMDFAIGTEVLICDHLLDLDTLEVLEEVPKRHDEELIGVWGSQQLSVEAGSTRGSMDAVWVRQGEGERTLLVDPKRQARFGTTARRDRERLVLAGTGALGAGGVLRYTDLAVEQELPFVERLTDEDATEPHEPYVVDALPDVPSASVPQEVTGPSGRLTWTPADGCTPWSDDRMRERAPASLEPAPVLTAYVIDVRTHALEGHAFPAQVERIESWLREDMDDLDLIERVRGLSAGLQGTMQKVRWKVGREPLPDKIAHADSAWRLYLETPLRRVWVRRDATEQRTRKPAAVRCQELSLDGASVGRWWMSEGTWAATVDGFLHVSDVPWFLGADGSMHDEHPGRLALATHYVGTDETHPDQRGVVLTGDTLALRTPGRLMWIDLVHGTVSEALVDGSLGAVIHHDGATWVVDREDQVIGHEPDGSVRAILPAPIPGVASPGQRSSYRIKALLRRDESLWVYVRYRGFFRWNGEAWQEVVAEEP